MAHEFLITRSTGRPFPSYRASARWVPGAGATDMAIFKAGARRVHVSRIFISAKQTANGVVDFRLMRKATATSGGGTVVTPAKGETLTADPTATLTIFTTPPTTLGTDDGAIRTTPSVISGGGAQAGIEKWTFIPETPEGLCLRSGESLGVRIDNLSDTGTAYLTVEWYEDPLN